MSFEYGMAAINLEMTDLVPRTEYSASMHWDLVNKVLGTHITLDSAPEQKALASAQFKKAWDYGMNWNVYTHINALNKCRTQMGHANFAAGGTDFNNQVYCPFEDPEDCIDFNPMEVYGKLDHAQLVKEYNENYHAKVAENPTSVNMTGIYISLVSGLIEIFGWDMMLMAMGIDEVGFGGVAERYSEWVTQYFEALADSDAPVVMIHDDMVWTSGAFAKPSWYREYIFPNFKKQLEPLREAGKKIMFTCDGNFTEFIDDIAACGVDGFVMEPTTQMEKIAERYGKTHSFVGNADTRILLNGTKDEIYAEVKRCMDIGKKCPGFFMAVGNHIPANTPVENALFYNEVFEELRRR